jgi:hypothetical protein
MVTKGNWVSHFPQRDSSEVRHFHLLLVSANGFAVWFGFLLIERDTYARQMSNKRSNHTRLTGRSRLLELVLVFLVAGCGIFPENVSISDQRVQSLLKAAAGFDRASYGFSPLPTSGRVSLEWRPRSGYDAMLHLAGKTSRTIAFRKNAADYSWIGEQEIFEGPKMYKSVDGTFHEEVTLTFEREHVSGVPLNKLSVSYMGEDPRLAGRVNLSLSDVRPILKEWGY